MGGRDLAVGKAGGITRAARLSLTVSRLRPLCSRPQLSSRRLCPSPDDRPVFLVALHVSQSPRSPLCRGGGGQDGGQRWAGGGRFRARVEIGVYINIFKAA